MGSMLRRIKKRSPDAHETRPLDPSTWDAFAELVERNNGVFGGCWCMGGYPEGLSRTDAEENRARKYRRVQDGAAHAALVFDEQGLAQGWCQYGDPEELARVKHRRAYEEEPPPRPDWRIQCFYVDRRHRGQGVARAALEGALEQIAALGGGRVEAISERAEPERAVLAFYSPEQIESLARSLATGAHRDPSRPALGEDEIEARAREDVQDAELVRVAAYAGLRRGELVALHWRDVDFTGRKLVIRRSLSGDTEVKSTKSRRVREVPLPGQAAVALERLRRRREFTGPDAYVFCSRLGRRLDPSALRRRYERARTADGLEPLRFHDLRHTYGSLLVAGGIDLVSVNAAMGHSRITTTERYFHARPACELADRFTRALTGSTAVAIAA